MEKFEFWRSVVKNHCEHFHDADKKNDCACCLKFIFLMSADYRIPGNQNKKNYKGKNIYAGDCRKIRSHELFLQNEQMTVVEPARQPWEGRVLPLYYICSSDFKYNR